MKVYCLKPTGKRVAIDGILYNIPFEIELPDHRYFEIYSLLTSEDIDFTSKTNFDEVIENYVVSYGTSEDLIRKEDITEINLIIPPVTKPTINGPNLAQPGSVVVLTASGSKSIFEKTVSYRWYLIDGTVHIGNSMSFIMGNATDYPCGCYVARVEAFDTYGNVSEMSVKMVCPGEPQNLPELQTYGYHIPGSIPFAY